MGGGSRFRPQSFGILALASCGASANMHRMMHNLASLALLEKFQAPVLSHAEACQFAHVNPRRVTNWQTRGHTNLGIQVSEKKRAMSSWECAELAVLSRLVEFFPVETAAPWARKIVGWFQEIKAVKEAGNVSELQSLATGRNAVVVIFAQHNSSVDITPNMTQAGLVADAIENSSAEQYPAPFLYIPLGSLMCSLAAALAPLVDEHLKVTAAKREVAD